VLRSDYTFEGEMLVDQLRILGACPRWPLRYELEPARAEPKRTVFYFPSASTPVKCWPRERFVELIRRAAAAFPQHDHRVLAGTGPNEGVDDIVAQLAGESGVQAAQRYSLAELGDALVSAALLVSNDTGVRNLALASGTPTVGIFFATQPYRYSPREPQHRSVFRSDASPPEVDEVFAAVSEQLEPRAPTELPALR